MTVVADISDNVKIDLTGNLHSDRAKMSIKGKEHIYKMEVFIFIKLLESDCMLHAFTVYVIMFVISLL